MALSAESTSTAPRYRTVLQGQRILVVEDEALIAMMIEEGLSGAGAEVVGPAFSVNEALRMIECAAFDGRLSAAVLDMNLHGAAVSAVADRLAALGVPFIFATGYGKDCDRGVHAAAPVLAKPFDPDALVAAVALACSFRCPPAAERVGTYTIGAGAAAVLVAAPNAKRKTLDLANTGTGTVYFGWDPAVTAATGYPLGGAGGANDQGGSYLWGRPGAAPPGTLYVFSTAGSTVTIREGTA